jgi:hypothetical protein
MELDCAPGRFCDAGSVSALTPIIVANLREHELNHDNGATKTRAHPPRRY